MDNDLLYSLVPLAIAFIAYFVIHSLLASLRFKRWVHHRWPEVMHAYRLAYNFLALILLLPLLWLMLQNPGPLLWQWTGWLGWLMKAGTLAAALGFIWSLKAYDNSVFLGIHQWRNRHAQAVEGSERLRISTLHRFVRHPWYFFLLVILWTQDLHLVQLLVYSLITLYLVLGSRLEERKLIAEYGEAYRDYCRRVPGLIPLPWRYLSAEDAARLEQQATEQEKQQA